MRRKLLYPVAPAAAPAPCCNQLSCGRTPAKPPHPILVVSQPSIESTQLLESVESLIFLVSMPFDCSLSLFFALFVSLFQS